MHSVHWEVKYWDSALPGFKLFSVSKQSYVILLTAESFFKYVHCLYLSLLYVSYAEVQMAVECNMFVLIHVL